MKLTKIISAICLSFAVATTLFGQDAAPESSRLATKSGLGLRVYTDAAYTSIQGGGQDYVISNISGFELLQGRVESVDPQDELVPTIGIAYGLSDDLEVEFRYSQIQSNSSEKIYDPNGNLQPTLTHPYEYDGVYEDATFASANLDYELSSYEIMFAKAFNLSDTMSTKLTFGFSHLKIKRELDALYEDGVNTPTYLNDNLNTTANGLKIGMATTVDLGSGFGAYGSAGLGLFQAKSVQRLKEGGVNDYEWLSLKQTDSHSLTTIDMSLGGTYTQPLGGGSLVIKLGYELTQFDGLFTTEFPDDVNEAAITRQDLDLSTSGFVLGLSYTF